MLLTGRRADPRTLGLGRGLLRTRSTASPEGQVVFVELSEAAQDDLPAIAKDQHGAAVVQPHLDIGGCKAVQEDRVIGAVEIGDRVVAVVDARVIEKGRGRDRR